MERGAATKEDIKKLQMALEKIEGKLSDKWLIPIVVAVITGITGTANILIQVRQQHAFDARVARYQEEEKAAGESIAKQKAEFYAKITRLISDSDIAFQELCYVTPDNEATAKAKTPLTSHLADYQGLVESAPYSLDTDTKSKLDGYFEYVTNTQFDIRFGQSRVAQETKHEYYRKALHLKGGAQEALRNYMKASQSPGI